MEDRVADLNPRGSWNKPFWVEILAYDGVQFYAWREVLPLGGFFGPLDGGGFGTAENNPVYEANGAALVVGNHYPVVEANFDPGRDTCFVVLSGSGGAGLAVAAEDGSVTVPGVSTVRFGPAAAAAVSQTAPGEALVELTPQSLTVERADLGAVIPGVTTVQFSPSGSWLLQAIPNSGPASVMFTGFRVDGSSLGTLNANVIPSAYALQFGTTSGSPFTFSTYSGNAGAVLTAYGPVTVSGLELQVGTLDGGPVGALFPPVSAQMNGVFAWGATVVTVSPSGGAVPAVASSSSGTGNNVASFAVAAPAGTAAGDLLVAHEASAPSGGGLSPPAGWTALGSSGPLQVFYKVAGAAEPVSYTFNAGGALTRAAALILRITGALPPPVLAADQPGSGAGSSLNIAYTSTYYTQGPHNLIVAAVADGDGAGVTTLISGAGIGIDVGGLTGQRVQSATAASASAPAAFAALDSVSVTTTTKGDVKVSYKGDLVVPTSGATAIDLKFRLKRGATVIGLNPISEFSIGAGSASPHYSTFSLVYLDGAVAAGAYAYTLEWQEANGHACTMANRVLLVEGSS